MWDFACFVNSNKHSQPHLPPASQPSTQFHLASSLVPSAFHNFQCGRFYVTSGNSGEMACKSLQRDENIFLCLWITAAVTVSLCVSGFSRGLVMMELLLTNLLEWAAALCERRLSVHDIGVCLFFKREFCLYLNHSHLLVSFNVVLRWIELLSVLPHEVVFPAAWQHIVFLFCHFI